MLQRRYPAAPIARAHSRRSPQAGPRTFWTSCSRTNHRRQSTVLLTRSFSGAFSTHNAERPVHTVTTQLLPDPGFESGNGGWIAFKVGTLTRVSTPFHGGSFALRVAATGTAANLVGLTQNTVISNSVAGRSYTASCYVEPTSSGSLDATIRLLEYTQNFGSNTQLQTVTVINLHLNTWTLVRVTGVAVRAGERIIPQIYSSKETTANGSLVYDDCSLTSQ